MNLRGYLLGWREQMSEKAAFEYAEEHTSRHYWHSLLFNNFMNFLELVRPRVFFLHLRRRVFNSIYHLATCASAAAAPLPLLLVPRSP